MNRLSLLLLSVFLWIAGADASGLRRIGLPVAATAYSEVLPQAQHPGWAADLAFRNEGLASLVLSGGGLSTFGVSVPGLQITTSRQHDFSPQTERSGKYSPEVAAQFVDTLVAQRITAGGGAVHRDHFRIAGALALGNWLTLRGWDLGVGVGYRAQRLIQENDQVLYTESSPTGGVSLVLGKMSTGVEVQSDETAVRVGYLQPDDLQFGLAFHINHEESKAFGAQIHGQKSFRDCLRLHAGWRIQYIEEDGSLVGAEQQFLMGTSLRFRPSRANRDPAWLKNLVEPTSNSRVNRFLYDWEVGAEFGIDGAGGGASVALNLGRWF